MYHTNFNLKSCCKAAFLLLAGCVLLAVSSCKKETTAPTAVTTCDTNQVSYSKVIVPLLSQNCYGCHSGLAATAGLRLEQYDVVKRLVTDGVNTLVNTVNGNPDFTYMPPSPGPKLPTCDINKLKAWVNQGALNN